MQKFSWRKPKEIRCIDCGFLTIGGREVSETERILLDNRGVAGLPGHLDQLDCDRGLWVDYHLAYYAADEQLLLKEATNIRRCHGYFAHVAGWSPEGHRTLLLRRQDRFRDHVSDAIFALLGAALALAVQWVAKRLSLG
jgi:hypothetical protein